MKYMQYTYLQQYVAVEVHAVHLLQQDVAVEVHAVHLPAAGRCC